jgi:hypothetical protein
VMWRKEHLWNFSVLQWVHLSNRIVAVIIIVIMNWYSLMQCCQYATETTKIFIYITFHNLFPSKGLYKNCALWKH